MYLRNYVFMSKGIKMKSESNQIILSIKGLQCANCAAKIEKKINDINEIEEANLDFIGEKILIKTSETNEIKLIDTIQKIADSIEDGVTISSRKKADNKEAHGHADVHGHSNNHGGEVARIIKLLIVGGIFFCLALMLPLPFKYRGVRMILYLLSYIIVGGDVLLKAFKNIKRGRIFDENFLMSIATIGAFAVGEYPEAVAVMLFYQLGEMFQGIAVNRSRKSISDLMDIRPDFANLKIGDKIEKVSPEDVKPGDIIIVKPGEKVPLDGEIVSGYSAFDTSALTGESLPREMGEGSQILSGYINKTGLINVKVTKIFSESTVSKILDLVQNASSKKSKTENFITKFASYYTPVVVIIAVLISIVPPLFIRGAVFADYSEWIYKGLVFLVLSCPCALVISIPLGFFGGIGGASKHGILIKGGNYLEALNKVHTVVMDKTGTLTKGIFKVTEINVSDSEWSEDELLKYTAYAESFSNHPIASSIVEEYERNYEKINKALISDFEEISGYGIKVTADDRKITAGNAKLMNSENISFTESEKAGTVIYVAADGKYIGNILIADEIKEDSMKAVEEMKKNGVKEVVMLTGDTKKIGESIAEKLHIDKVFTELLPDQKVEKLEELFMQRSAKEKIMFVGDGINDAPVLARADIGVAMGGVGSDAAIEAADVVIMNDEPSKIVTAMKIAKRTRTIVWQNIIIALGIKFIILALGIGGHATMWEAVFADVGVALIAILNAMRVMKGKF